MQLRSSPSERRGVVLLSVLIVITVLSLAAYHYSEWTMAEAESANSSIKATQSQILADSGVHYVAALLASDPGSSPLNGNPLDNPEAFEGITIPSGADTSGPGKFSIVSLLPPDSTSGAAQPYRFGLADEAGKINLNSLLQLDNGKGDAGQQILMALPGMTQDVANSILDWLDPDDTPRDSGAESDYYSGLATPYQTKNGPLDTLEELLLVKGVTPQLLFGNDRNRNGTLDPGEDDGTGSVNQGWAAYLTVYSREPNVDSSGNPRIYLNDSDLNTLNTNLTTALGADLANFILAYRMNGPAPTSSGSTKSSAPTQPQPAKSSDPDSRTALAKQVQTGLAGSASGSGASMGSGKTGGGMAGASGAGPSGAGASGSGGSSGGGGGGKNKITSLFSLVNASVNVTSTSGGKSQSTPSPSPLSDPSQQAKLLPLLLDKTTTTTDTDLQPRINVNTASQTVLTAIAQQYGLNDSDVQNILAQQPQPGSSPDPIFQTPAWLLTRANLTADTMKKLENAITARSGVYRFQSVASAGSGPGARVEAVVDANAGRPRIVYWRNLSELGPGFHLPGSNQK